MRWSALLLILALGGVAHAEKVKTNQQAKLYSHAGEAGEVLITIKAGQAMTVLAKEGRWLKVRVNGRTGYVPRSKVDMPDGDDEVQRNTRRRPFVDGRGTNRGFGGEAGPDDRVGADATGAGGGGGDDAKGGGDDDDGDKGKAHADKPKAKADKPKAKGGKGKGDDDDVADDDDKGGKGKGKGDDGDKGDDDGKGDKGDEGKPEDSRPIVHVTANTKVLQDPKKGSEVAFKAKPDDKLFLEEKKGKWTEVSMEEGDAGWVLTSQLDLDSAGIGTHAITKREIDLRVRAGLTVINQGIRTTGSTMVGVPDNYNVGTSAAVLALGGQYLTPYKADYLIGGELAYAYNKAAPGIAYMSQNIGFSVHDLNIRVVGGYDLHKSSGMTVLAHVGYKYQSFLVSNVDNFALNTAKIPSEVYKAPTLGGGLWIPRITPSIGVRATLDLVLAGASITQTKNLEDGGSPSAKGADLGLQFTYKWRPGLDLQATYDLNYAGINFGAPLASSMRNHGGTDVTRTDIFHTLTFGITKSM